MGKPKSAPGNSLAKYFTAMRPMQLNNEVVDLVDPTFVVLRKHLSFGAFNVDLQDRYSPFSRTFEDRPDVVCVKIWRLAGDCFANGPTPFLT